MKIQGFFPYITSERDYNLNCCCTTITITAYKRYYIFYFRIFSLFKLNFLKSY